HGCSSLNLEGLALLDFHARVSYDPNGAFISWNINDHDPCSWSHVHCVSGHVHAINLKGQSLEGVLAPELGNLTHLRRLVLSHNHFSGVIPKELGELKLLEMLDLRANKLIGKIPPEIEKLQSLNILLLYNNNLEENIPQNVENLNFLYKLQFVPNFTFNVKDAIRFLNRKLGGCIWQGNFNPNSCVLFKGTLPNGVEICVASTTITRLKDWSKRAELALHKKIETLSRVNHKNFVNLIGYCEEDEPFVRMMVFEYAPHGTLSEHLHVQALEHLDWRSRIRIIMGVAYCLQCMHDLNPPVTHMHLDSNTIYLTDDFAAKIACLNFWKEFYPKTKMSGANESLHSPRNDDKETDIYSFGVLLLEIVSGKHQNIEKLEPLVTWAEQFLEEKENISHIIDPDLKSFELNELEIVCEVIQECIKKDGSQRPSINEIIPKLREVLKVSPQQATPRLSPLWWAELELLSIKEGTT
ncbi:hypothetical protein M8C21_006720, partial [Ambrosia artemisiifolia]